MKTPKDSPTEVGQLVELRGRGALGVVEKIYYGWVWVKWEAGVNPPKICSVTELRVLDENTFRIRKAKAFS